MSDRIKHAQECLARVSFPEMDFGTGGTIWTKDGVKVATLNLHALTVPEALAFASAFVAAGEALAALAAHEGETE